MTIEAAFPKWYRPFSADSYFGLLAYRNEDKIYVLRHISQKDIVEFSPNPEKQTVDEEMLELFEGQIMLIKSIDKEGPVNSDGATAQNVFLIIFQNGKPILVDLVSS